MIDLSSLNKIGHAVIAAVETIVSLAHRAPRVQAAQDFLEGDLEASDKQAPRRQTPVREQEDDVTPASERALPPPSSARRRQIYNFRDGRSYAASISLSDADTLRVEGCAFGGVVCGSQNWSRVN